MTREQLTEITDKLKKWREERQLTYEKQSAGLTANLLEECVEYLRAKDDEERIDALCDILVFSFNSLSEVNIKALMEDEEFSEHSRDKKIFRNIVYNINKLDIWVDDKDKYECDSMLEYIIIITIYLIKRLGYNPYECMLETIKEISSRTGEWNDTIKKFVKYQGAYNDFEANEIVRKLDEKFQIVRETETYWYYGIRHNDKYSEQGKLVKWYRADYSKCKGQNK